MRMVCSEDQLSTLLGDNLEAALSKSAIDEEDVSRSMFRVCAFLVGIQGKGHNSDNIE